MIYAVNQQSHSPCQGGNFAAVLGKGLWLPQAQPPVWLPPGVQPYRPHSTAGDASRGERESVGLQQMWDAQRSQGACVVGGEKGKGLWTVSCLWVPG